VGGKRRGAKEGCGGVSGGREERGRRGMRRMEERSNR